jgi:DNA-binding NarL/FixJ family response regulator
MLRDGLVKMIESTDYAFVAATMSDCHALPSLGDGFPDVRVTIVEVGDPFETGAARVDQVVAACPGSRVLVLGRDGDMSVAQAFLRRGASAYLPTATRRDHLLAALRLLVNDQDSMVVIVSRDGEVESPPDVRAVLSRREREVVELIAGAATNMQIARRLGITEGTVKRHVSNILTKLGAVSRLDAVKKAGVPLGMTSVDAAFSSPRPTASRPNSGSGPPVPAAGARANRSPPPTWAASGRGVRLSTLPHRDRPSSGDRHKTAESRAIYPPGGGPCQAGRYERGGSPSGCSPSGAGRRPTV